MSVQDLSLWYHRPATSFNEALPLGNGRLGAMVYGGVDEELITLNHDTLWSGIPRDFSVPGGREALSLAREALFEGNVTAAEKFCRKLQGPYGQSYFTDHRTPPRRGRCLSLGSSRVFGNRKAVHSVISAAGFKISKPAYWGPPGAARGAASVLMAGS